MIVQISQALIFFFGVSAFWFTSGKTNHHRVIGATLGLIGQVFWFVVTIHAQQWWIVLLCCFYTFNWCRLLWNNLRAEIEIAKLETYVEPEFFKRLRNFKNIWGRIFRYYWYNKILGRRRSIRKDEDCEFYVNKERPGRCKPYECWGDGHYECRKSCLHYKPEPINE